MANEILTLNSAEATSIDLKSYNVTLPMGTLAIGVDNIHHDVFLSPKFVQAAREYLFDLIRQHTSSTYFPGIAAPSMRSRTLPASMSRAGSNQRTSPHGSITKISSGGITTAV